MPRGFAWCCGLKPLEHEKVDGREEAKKNPCKIEQGVRASQLGAAKYYPDAKQRWEYIEEQHIGLMHACAG